MWPHFRNTAIFAIQIQNSYIVTLIGRYVAAVARCAIGHPQTDSDTTFRVPHQSVHQLVIVVLILVAVRHVRIARVTVNGRRDHAVLLDRIGTTSNPAAALVEVDRLQ